MWYGLYEQVINNQLTSELVEIPEARKAIAPIDKAEASKVLRSIWRMWFRRAWITFWILCMNVHS